LVAVIALSAPAAAERIGLIVLGRGDAPDRAAIADSVRAAAEKGDEIVDGQAEARANLLAGAVPAAQLERFGDVRADADAGWQAFVDGNAQSARSKLVKARTDTEALLALDGGVELYADISLRLGVVLDSLGDKAKAADAIRLALNLDPNREISTREFAPNVIATINAIPLRPSGTLHRVNIAATTATGGAVSIDVDGISRGQGAIDLALGQHVVIARATGYRAVGQAFDVTPTSDRLIEVTLDADRETIELRAPLAPGADDRRSATIVDAVMTYAEVDAVLLVGTTWRRDAPAVLAQRCTGTPSRCTDIVEIGYAEGGIAAAVASAIAELEKAPFRIVASIAGDDRWSAGTNTGDRCNWCRSPWLWAGVGTAVVLGTVLAVVAIDDDPPTFIFEGFTP
jgi:hypothetical protein